MVSGLTIASKLTSQKNPHLQHIKVSKLHTERKLPFPPIEDLHAEASKFHKQQNLTKITMSCNNCACLDQKGNGTVNKQKANGGNVMVKEILCYETKY